MPCPAMPCHDTHSSTQTCQPLWPGLISCHSGRSRDQGHYVVCSLTAQVPAELPQTLTTQEQCVYVWGSECMCTGMHAYTHLCVRGTDTMRVKKKKDRTRCWWVYMDAVYTYSLTEKQKEAHFIENVGRIGYSVGVCMIVCLGLEKLNCISVNFCLSLL